MMSSVQAASLVIKNAIEGASGPLPPAFLMQFMLNYWRQYLALTHHTCGEDSPEWHAAIAESDLLLWSVAPKLSEQERIELGKSLEGLVLSIKRGMTVAGFDNDVQKSFLQQLSQWHLDLISKNKSASGSTTNARSEFDPNDTVQLRGEDLRRRELLDMLENAYIQHIEVNTR